MSKLNLFKQIFTYISDKSSYIYGYELLVLLLLNIENAL